MRNLGAVVLVGLVCLLSSLACSKDKKKEPAPSSAAATTPSPSAKPVAPPSCKDIAECEAKCSSDAAACGQAGWLHFKAGDGKTAMPLLQKACDAGQANYCLSAAQLLFGGAAGVAKNEAASRPLFEKACAAKLAKGCAQASIFYFEGSGGVAKDEKKGIEFETDACRLGFIPACAQTAADMIKQKDHKSARPIAQLGCASNDAKSCALLGSLLEEDKEIEPAKAAYDTACKHGFKQACEWKDQVGKAPPAAHEEAAEADEAPAGDEASSAAPDPKAEECKQKGEHFTMCNDECTDLMSHDDCGRCGAACMSDETCAESTSFGIACQSSDGTYTVR